MKFAIHNLSWIFGSDPAYLAKIAAGVDLISRGRPTLGIVARMADACTVFGAPHEVRQKFALLRHHCQTEDRRYEAIEQMNMVSLLLARNEAALETND